MTSEELLRQDEDRAAKLEAESPPHVEAFLDHITDGWEPGVLVMPEGVSVMEYLEAKWLVQRVEGVED